eukprot:TRINITY_DN4400_c0_g1_i1.p1 TRINITY_DN4400_c0_g1~~TRINITY_DN4400_c0_g1_i1.p1  ORF type:complete len:276 (+),score=37.45 TRINITY_DN4400_c0_g1_i1:92-829(+)
MSSAKTLNLLATAHSYEVQSKTIKVMKPKMDTRFGEGNVGSRAGLSRSADVLITPDTTFSPESLKGVSCVLVDEAQFLHPRVVERLRDVATNMGIPVICYGLRTDFRSRLFPGSQRLLELADTIEEVKTTCTYCNRKAIMNLKSVDGKETMAGPTVCLGAEEMYVPSCYQHFCERLVSATGAPIDFQGAWAAGDKADAAQQAEASVTKFESSPEKVSANCEGGYHGGRAQEPEPENTPQKLRRVD